LYTKEEVTVTADEIKEQRLQGLLVAMQAGEDIEDRDLSLREAARYANRVPAESNLSSVLADIQTLIERGDVKRVGAGARCYRVVRHDPKTVPF
jgi:hypothetical protein